MNETKSIAALETAQEHDDANPANSAVTRDNRVSMSVPRAKLACPKIPGFRTYWFNNEPGRIESAKAAGYVFVSPEEVSMPGGSLGNDDAESRNTDLGSMVSMVGGGLTRSNEPVRLYLMKIPEEYFQDDMNARDEQTQTFIDSLFGARSFGNGNIGDAALGPNGTYLDRSRSKIPAFFKRKKPS